MKAIPVAPAKLDSELLAKAYDEVEKAFADGQLVCIFPEGQLTTDGEIGEFRSGVSHILERTPVPVIPMALSGLWQSIFSRNRSRKHFVKLFPKVRLNIGRALAPTGFSLEHVRDMVMQLQGEQYRRREQ